jgi:hypothetical protein
VRRQQTGQGGQHGAVGPVRLRLGDLAAQDSDFMTKHQNLRELGGGVLIMSCISQGCGEPSRWAVRWVSLVSPAVGCQKSACPVSCGNDQCRR